MYLHFLVNAQEFPFKDLEHVGNQYGLINNYFSDIVKDKYGRFWLGSLNGIITFDGFKTSLIKLPKAKDGIVLSNSISRLYLDGDTLLWIGQTYGVCCYNLKTNEIISVKVKKESPTQSLEFYFIFKDQAGDFWISTRELGLQRLNRNNLEFSKTGDDLIDKKERVTDYQILDDTFLTFNHSRSISVYNTKTKRLEQKLEEGNHFYYLSEDIFQGKIYSSLIKPECVYFGRRLPGEVNYSFFRYNRANQDTVRYDIPSIMGRRIFEDSRGNIWFYNEGVSVIEKKSGKLYFTDTDVNYGFSMCNRIYEDEEHNLWFCTNYGLFVYNLDNIEINNFSEKVNNELRGHIFTDFLILKEGGSVYGTFGDGILFFDRNFNYQANKLFNTQKDSPDNTISSLVQDRDSSLWLGLLFGKLVRYSRSKDQSTVYAHEMLEKSRIMSIQIRKNGELILLTQNGRIVSFNKESEDFKLLYDPKKDRRGPIDYVNSTLLLNDTLLVIGTINAGLFTYNLTSNIKRQYVFNPTDSSSIESNVIIDVNYCLKRVIVAHERGLDVFNPGNGRFSRLLKNPNLPFSECYSIVQISPEEIAVNTSDGLYKIKPDKGMYFRVGRGTILDKSNYRMKFVGEKRVFVFATDSYVYYFKDKKTVKGIKPVCFIYTLETKDTLINYSRVNDRVEFRRDQNTIRIDLGSNTYSYKGYLDYYYKIEGETDWINNRESREIMFNNLRGGDYMILVKCLNKESNLFSDEIIFNISIQKSFYETNWFYVLIFVLLFLMIYVIYRIRINRVLAVERVRSKLSRDLHDDMGSTLSTINILSGIIKLKIENDTKAVLEYVDRISTYSQDMMDSMQDIVWSINPSNDSMSKVVVKMREFASNVLEPKDIQFLFNIEGDPDKFSLRMENRRDFYLIFKEAINNAAKYADANKIIVEMKLKQNQISLSITDNGKGFDTNSEKSGNGLLNMKRRAQLINAQFSLKSSLNSGTQIELVVNT
ncbi:MAG: histidine kinase [Bacteroidia bacterium]|jgi:ligand-binding sensor domain-containing protein/two-component sensor histidine kinase|nr:histidine kinase [Bacteroidia bacterium]